VISALTVVKKIFIAEITEIRREEFKSSGGKMRKILWLLLLVAATSVPALAQSDIAAMRRMFDYDKNAPLYIKEVNVIKRDNVRIHDITYASPKNGIRARGKRTQTRFVV
jgi:hypothetical protein